MVVLFPPHGKACAPFGHDHFGVRLEFLPRTQAGAVQWSIGAAKRGMERAVVEEDDETMERRQHLTDAGSHQWTNGELERHEESTFGLGFERVSVFFRGSHHHHTYHST